MEELFAPCPNDHENIFFYCCVMAVWSQFTVLLTMCCESITPGICLQAGSMQLCKSIHPWNYPLSPSLQFKKFILALKIA